MVLFPPCALWAERHAARVMGILLFALLAFLSPALFAADPVPPEEAYPAHAYRVDNETIAVEFAIRRDYYLYRDKVRVEPLTEGLQLGAPQLPPGKKKRDDFFGETEVYYDTLRFTLPVVTANGAEPWRLRIISQGCWNGGVCYPPLEQEVTVADAPPARSLLGALFNKGAAGAGAPAPGTQPEGAIAKGRSPAAPPPSDQSTPPSVAQDKKTAPINGSGDVSPPATDEAGSLARFIAQQQGGVVLAAFFGFGLLLAFTPCVFPMIPILSGIIVGQGAQLSRARALVLTATYVLAMSLTYALAGVAAGLSGALVQTALQQPAVLVAFAVLFVLLALSLFGFYELQLPASWQNRLNALAGSQQGGQLVGVAVMGILSALIVSPCVAPPLVGALLYISQSGDALFGGAALFALGLGMGAPLLAVGVGARELLPRSGPWLNGVKAAMGVVMLGVAWWIVRPVLPETLWLAGWGVLAIGCAVALGALEPLPVAARWPKQFGKTVGLLLLAYGVAAFWGALAGNRDPLQPLAGFAAQQGKPEASAPTFRPIASLEELQAVVAASGRPTLVDVRADWCVSCLELERTTFTDPQVVALLKEGVTLLKMDVTANNASDQAFMRHFQIYGPPALLLFDANGKERTELRVTGYMDGSTFAAHLRRWLGQKS